MTIKELRQMSETELGQLLSQSREQLRDMRFKAARRELKNVREVRTKKETIARILTLQKKI
ncbi:MAG: 50S ribosomal protein L29 [bacterium]|nr:50S ribosomal protein L29 [bacterium]